MFRLGGTCLVLALLWAALPSEAHAWRISGQNWPNDRISYNVQARAYERAVDHAAAMWNRARVGVRFVKTSPARANVLIRYGGRRCHGRGEVGFDGWAEPSYLYIGNGCDEQTMVLTAAHELGHVLGLGHEDRGCARMNSTSYMHGTPRHCRVRPTSYWLKNPLRPDDVAGARRLYDGDLFLPPL